LVLIAVAYDEHGLAGIAYGVRIGVPGEHQLARGALYAKRATTDPTTWPAEARVWASARSRIENPPRGRIMDLVYERLAEELAITPDAAKHLIFRRR
jgi:hypothetical protein